MSTARGDPGLHANRPVDFSRLDAIGFDLDHTLALYDDHAVNLLAAAETADLLLDRLGYPAEWMGGIDPEHVPAARTMALDLRDGAIVKVGADRSVRAARRARRWLSAPEMERRYPPGGSREESFYPLHSPFDIPVMWFFEHLAGHLNPRGDDSNLHELASDIRRMLDFSHTRGGLKSQIGGDIERFVAPAGDVRGLLRSWSDDGRRLFVVTNSHRDYASLVLDAVVGDEWRSLFDLVIVDADKPAFFDGAGGLDAPAARAPGGDAVVLERAGAGSVEALLGAAGDRVLYVGDNVRADISAARSRGWRTAQVVPELLAGESSSPWGSLLTHDGAPTRFTRSVVDHADLVVDRVDRLLQAPIRGRLEARADLLARMGDGIPLDSGPARPEHGSLFRHPDAGFGVQPDSQEPS